MNQSKASITASTTSWVVLVPPRSFVRYLPSRMTFSTATSKRSANAGNWRCLSIIADERRSATGLAVFCAATFSLPTFPAEAPCSKTACSAPTLPAKKAPRVCE
ncbi:isocitrate dehydrogenase [NAD] regulatory subunit 1, mitochondrial [Trifolium repens]|nr:isocitrate dehydrogenase [NAD] regulatory subunit 1, mitochondrial [Trifolium repens]